MLVDNRASTRESLVFVDLRKKKHRPACASAQSDQRLCFSHFGKYYTKTCYKRIFNFLASLCSWAGWFESGFFGNPEDKFSHDEAQLISNYLDKSASFSNLDGMPNEMLQSHTTDQPMAPWGRDIGHKQPCNNLEKSASFSNLDGMPNEMLQSHTADQPMAPWGRDIAHKQPCNYLGKSASFSNLDGMPNEMLQSHTTDQPMAPWGRDIEHKQPCNYLDKSAS